MALHRGFRYVLTILIVTTWRIAWFRLFLIIVNIAISHNYHYRYNLAANALKIQIPTKPPITKKTKKTSVLAAKQESANTLQQKTSECFKSIVSIQDSLVEIEMKIMNTTKAIKQRKDYMKTQNMSISESTRLKSAKR